MSGIEVSGGKSPEKKDPESLDWAGLFRRGNVSLEIAKIFGFRMISAVDGEPSEEDIKLREIFEKKAQEFITGHSRRMMATPDEMETFGYYSVGKMTMANHVQTILDELSDESKMDRFFVLEGDQVQFYRVTDMGYNKQLEELQGDSRVTNETQAQLSTLGFKWISQMKLNRSTLAYVLKRISELGEAHSDMKIMMNEEEDGEFDVYIFVRHQVEEH